MNTGQVDGNNKISRHELKNEVVPFNLSQTMKNVLQNDEAEAL